MAALRRFRPASLLCVIFGLERRFLARPLNDDKETEMKEEMTRAVHARAADVIASRGRCKKKPPTTPSRKVSVDGIHEPAAEIRSRPEVYPPENASRRHRRAPKKANKRGT